MINSFYFPEEHWDSKNAQTSTFKANADIQFLFLSLLSSSTFSDSSQQCDAPPLPGALVLKGLKRLGLQMTILSDCNLLSL